MRLLIPADPYGWAEGLPLKAQQAQARQWCTAQFSGLRCLNRQSGDAVLIQGGGIKHSIHMAFPPLLRAMSLLPQAIEQAEYLGRFPDKANRPDIVAAHKYEAVFDDAGHLLFAQIVARELRAGREATELHFYDFAFIKR